MYGGDRSRKEELVEFGFRLPSALDNRPLTFDEFERHIRQAVYVSATPGPYELRAQRADRRAGHPPDRPDRSRRSSVRPTDGQIDDLLERDAARASAKGQRVLVTTLTKRMAEDLTDYLQGGRASRTQYLHQRHRDAGARSRSCATCASASTTWWSASTCLREGSGPAGSLAGGDPRRRQGRLPALGELADPDDRAAPRATSRAR